MNIKLLIIENLRQIQIGMIRLSYQTNKSHSSFSGQGRILSLLKDSGEMSRTELGEKLQMSRAAMAELLGKMEKSGLIERIQNPKDKRRIDIKLTKAGKRAAGHTDLDNSPLPDMLNCLDGKELNQLNEYLERIVNYNKELSGGDAEKPLSSEESRQIKKNVVDPICEGCPGPESCKHDYIKYGHDRPNPDYCKYADQFPF